MKPIIAEDIQLGNEIGRSRHDGSQMQHRERRVFRLVGIKHWGTARAAKVLHGRAGHGVRRQMIIAMRHLQTVFIRNDVGSEGRSCDAPAHAAMAIHNRDGLAGELIGDSTAVTSSFDEWHEVSSRPNDRVQRPGAAHAAHER
jgi:hypothetical protein